MSSDDHKANERDAVRALSESSPVRLGLVVIMCGGIWWGASALAGLSAKIDANAAVQDARMDTQKVLIEGLARDVARQSDSIDALSERVRSLEKGTK